MNLYLKQKVFSWGDKFTVYDENGNDKFYVKGEVFSIGKKLHVYDLNDNELCYIHQKAFSFLLRFFISKNGIDIAEIVKKFTLLRQVYLIEGFNWTVEGDFFAHDYVINSPSGTVAQISKQWFSWGDTYEINIAPGFDEIDVLAVVLIIDACLALSSGSAAATV